MATQVQMTPDSIHPEDVEIYEQLAKLQAMYTQVGELRLLLPDKLLAPTRQSVHRSPGKLASGLKDAAIDGSTRITTFKRAYHNEEMRALWRKSNDSDVPQGDDVWSVDYAKVLQDFRRSSTTKLSTQPEVGTKELDVDVEATLKAFRESYPDIKIHSTAESSIPFDIEVSTSKFRVATSDASRPYTISSASPEPPSMLQRSILQYIEQSHPQANLSDVLGILASYRNVESTPCHKCRSIFDNALQLPLSRKQIEAKDGWRGTIWQALHSRCV